MASSPVVTSENSSAGRSAQHKMSSRTFSFADRWKLQELAGPLDENLQSIEDLTGTKIDRQSLEIKVHGEPGVTKMVEDNMRDIYRRIECGEEISASLINSVFKMFNEPKLDGIIPANDPVSNISIRTRRKTIHPRSIAQGNYMRSLASADMTFGLGPAGTGKTYLAVAQAVSMLVSGEVKRLVISRPAVEAGEKLGFLPGDMKEKVDPYLRPIYDALYDCLPPEQAERKIEAGEIEVAPLAFMRGRTLSEAFIILDEAQNTTPAQMKMFLTRFGEGSRMVVCGDPNQTDIPGGPSASGLADAVKRLSDVEGINFCRFGAEDVVRHAIVGRIVKAYDDPSL